MNTRAFRFALVVGLACWAGGGLQAQVIPVPNPSFEEGNGGPDGWELSGGVGEWSTLAAAGAKAIATTGSGKDSNYWRSPVLPFEPRAVYLLSFRAIRVDGSGGCPITGPGFCNRDLGGITDSWQAHSSVFATPSTLSDDARLRFGQWEVTGTVAYDDVRLVRVQPVYHRESGLVLGEGESVLGTEYVFQAPLQSVSANQSRPLGAFNATFNTHRWVFGGDSFIEYAHEVGDISQDSAQVDVNIGYYTGGALVVEARNADDMPWVSVAMRQELGNLTAELPASLFPARRVQVRLRAMEADELGAEFDPGSFQVYAYTYRAVLEKDLGTCTGSTRFLAVTQSDPKVEVRVTGFGDGVPGGGNVFLATVNNTTQSLIKARPTIALKSQDGAAEEFAESVDLPPGETEIRLPYELGWTGEVAVQFSLGPDLTYAAATFFDISSLYDSSYGELLPSTSDDVALWWASSGWKVSRTRALPKQKGAALRIQAARNEAEAAQFVVCPKEALTGLSATPGSLTSKAGGTIPAEAMELLRVRYVNITTPTDAVGAAAPWPDPLPPLEDPIDVDAGRHQPIWVRVTVPPGTLAGVYRGVIALDAEGYSGEVPVEVEVFDFDLPDRMTCTTAFGFEPSLAFRYQRVPQEQQREVLDKYLTALGRHHITPYNPAPLDPPKVSWPGLGPWEGGNRVTSEKYRGEGSLMVVDDSATVGPNAAYADAVVIPEGGVRLQLHYRTAEPGQTFLVTINHLDANDLWMPGRNVDIAITGDGTWQAFDKTITTYPEGARKFRLTLWPTTYAEDGSTTGTVWYDELLVTLPDSGDTLIACGFEPIRPADLVPQIDWTDWDKAMELAFGKYHFNSFAVHVPGMGGGTFHARYEPNLFGYGEDTPEYKAMFTSYCQAFETHLREKGWLDMSYVYWFDEPDPKDYDFVMNGFRKLKESAPEIGRMLTEQVEPALVGGPNIWCPLTPEFEDPSAAYERMDAGDIFWWYVCTGPKAPYVTLFTDHPGTEMRVWGWQTWQHRVRGLLVWQTNYWTSPTAYPDPERPQDPYADPMSWTVGYGTPVGTKLPWGNGDGRFIYPPEAAADGAPAEPVLDGPVVSIRFEMLRDGIEDYEYLAMLDRLVREKAQTLSENEAAEYRSLLEVPADVSRDLTHFTTDPAPVERRREAVARAIEALTRK